MAKKYKEQFYIDPYFIATEGLGAIACDHIIAPLTVASLGYLALELVEIRVGGGDNGGAGVLELPEYWRWKPIIRDEPKSLDEIKEILRRHLSEEEVDEFDTVKSNDDLEQITDKIPNPVDVNQIKTIIQSILKDPTINLVEIDLNSHSTKRLNARNKKIIAKYIEKKVEADLFATMNEKAKPTTSLKTEAINIADKPKIKIRILDKDFEK